MRGFSSIRRAISCGLREWNETTECQVYLLMPRLLLSPFAEAMVDSVRAYNWARAQLVNRPAKARVLRVGQMQLKHPKFTVVLIAHRRRFAHRIEETLKPWQGLRSMPLAVLLSGSL